MAAAHAGPAGHAAHNVGPSRRALPIALAALLVVSAAWAAVIHELRPRYRPPAVGAVVPVDRISPSPDVLAPSPTSSPATPTPSAVPLVAWHGPVESLFVHPLVLEPRLAFTSDRLGLGFRNYFVTAHEFRGMLDGLWRNGWTLVDVHRAAAGSVRVPAGRKPLVLIEDDANYSAYFDGRGLAQRLVLDPSGAVRGEYGGELTDEDVVPLVDQAVAAHPELSADGAKGVLALTGYEGLLGEHDLADPTTRARATALASRLRATGWVFASHTYGHITLSRASTGTIARDTARWRALADGVLGPVDVLVYPYGSRPTRSGLRALRDEGFRIQWDIDVRAHRAVVDGVVVMSRRHVDGLAFDHPSRLAPFFDVAAVRDPDRPR